MSVSRMTHRGSETGFTMVEVLVTLVIVSIGLLSSVALQLLSKRSNYDAAQRTTAAHLAEDLLERMRANPIALLDYATAGVLGNGSQGAAPVLDCVGPLANCTGPDLAAYDLWQWEQLLDGNLELNAGQAAGGLVAPSACIRGPAFGGNGVYTVAIAWRGLTELSNPIVDACGEGSGNYGDDDVNRRVLVVRTFINAT